MDNIWSDFSICVCFSAVTSQSLQEASCSRSSVEHVGAKEGKKVVCFMFFSYLFGFPICIPGHQSGFCMICVMQNHIIQAFANTGNAIKPVSFIRDLKSKYSWRRGWLSASVKWVNRVHLDQLRYNIRATTSLMYIFSEKMRCWPPIFFVTVLTICFLYSVMAN